MTWGGVWTFFTDNPVLWLNLLAVIVLATGIGLLILTIYLSLGDRALRFWLAAGGFVLYLVFMTPVLVWAEQTSRAVH